MLTRRVVASSPPSVEYALTALGRELIPVIDAIVQVGTKLQQLAAEPTPQPRPRPLATSESTPRARKRAASQGKR